MSDQIPSAEVTSDDKLWAAAMYLLPGLSHLVIYFGIKEKMGRPFIRAHFAQSLAMGVVSYIIAFILTATVILSCVFWLPWIYQIFLTIQAYQGKYITIPVITDFVKNQGWA